VSLEAWVGVPSSLCVFSPTCGDALAMEHNGDVYSCDHPAYCRNCDYLRACYGECPKHRFIKTPDGEPGLNYLCAAYKKFYSHVDPYMAFMAGELAQQRPPENVMEWTRDATACPSSNAMSAATICAHAAAAANI
jgi:uncharacterized protein